MTRIYHRARSSLSNTLPGNPLGSGFAKSAEVISRISKPNGHSENVARAYDQAGSDYGLYADGEFDDLFDFTSIHAYADRRLWIRLNSALLDLRETGTDTISILDAGCGPGTWLRRLVLRAHQLGFTNIRARGFDIAREQIRRARFLSKELETFPGVELRFDVGDLTKPFPDRDASADLTICLYSVLSHLPMLQMKSVAAEIARVTRGGFITTVRPPGSLPTVFVDSVEKAVTFKHHEETDKFDVRLNDGRQFTLDVHLYKATELEQLFSVYFRITELVGLDLFHSRFAPDTRWNPASQMIGNALAEHLARLEEIFTVDPAFLDHATHLLLAGSRRSD